MKQQTTTRLYELKDACQYARKTIKAEYPNFIETMEDQNNMAIMAMMVEELEIAINLALTDKPIDWREA